jgi:hypothetical protein
VDVAEVTDLLADRSFDVTELEDDDVVLDVIVLARVMRASDFGSGRSALLLVPQDGMDSVIQSGMLHNAVDLFRYAQFDEGQDR